ncbi:hypothetical protein CTAYLR_000781 [Chrysophaeum taylorii]|uniref:CAAX prenyl protease 2/Lysostaphin resistance protein A-like domain-containing protein n=1 Tax=Chrysophaeum taylorii TaxID=2483200 RepID=A0AAD7UR17_9STRA|nr:hypothetical protein CTAYLR_000781 [Chrysophaeum taylorii]
MRGIVMMVCVARQWRALGWSIQGLGAQRVRVVAATKGEEESGSEEEVVRRLTEKTLPLDFGSRDTAWEFEWAEESEEEWDARDILTGAAVFVACHLNAVVLAGGVTTFSRVLGATAFVAAQANAGSPIVPLRRGLSLEDVWSRFQWTQAIPVSRVGRTAWPLVALGASIPAFQAVVIPLALSESLDGLRVPGVIFDPYVQLVVPACEEVVFRLWFLEASKRAGLPYATSILASGVLFGLWHGLEPKSVGLGVLGSYWGHLYAQTGNVLVPIAMHALWNTFALYSRAALPIPPVGVPP